MDWALEAEAGACIGLLVRCARARGVGTGTGEVAPLSTSTEHFHGCTNAVMQLRLAEVAAEAAGRLAKVEAREAVPPAGASLWGPGGKQLQVGRKLSNSVGRNDKTRVLLRLQAAGEGAPGREAPVSAEEQAAMLAFYRKKQAEAQALAAAEPADADSAAWADPRSLKASFAGIGALRLGGRGGTGFNQGVM